MATPSNQNKKKTKYKIIILVCIVVLLIVAAAAAVFVSKLNDANSNESKLAQQITNKVSGYDINKLSRTYPDIVAWLDIPNTAVSFPIVQHPENDLYYLNHDPQCQYSDCGACYIELCNSKDFSDPVTVAYGHNMNDGTMFNNIHYFEDANFFNENDKFYVYTQGHKLTYTVVASAATDNSHIMNSHNFKDVNVLRNYQQQIVGGLSTTKHVRSDVTLNDDSKILQLSTCMSDPKLSNQRYILTGVLTDDQPTL